MRLLLNENESKETKIDRLNELLESGWVMFLFEKVDGSSRTAIGTRNDDLIREFAEKNNLSKTSIDKSEYTRQHDVLKGFTRYFDITGKGTRTFYTKNLVGCDTTNMTTEEVINYINE